MYCKKCGEQISDHAKFCPKCGEKIYKTEPENRGTPKKKTRFWILPGCIAAAAAVLLLILWRGRGKEQEPYEWDPGTAGSSSDFASPLKLSADENYFVAGNGGTVTFTLEGETNGEEITLHCAEEEGSLHMNDSGVDGDAQEGDGICSCTVQVEQETAGSREYFASSAGLESNTVSVYFFEQPTEETAQEAQECLEEVRASIREIEDRYRDPEGYVPEEKHETLLLEIEKILEKYVEGGSVLLYAADDCGIYIKMTSGLTFMYEPLIPDTNAGGEDVSLKFWLYEPNPDVAVENFPAFIREHISDIPTCSYGDDYSGAEVTLELIKNLPSNSVILWNGHGGAGPFVKSYLTSGESFDWSAWWKFEDYYEDCTEDRIIQRDSETQKGIACFTSKFIDHYCKDLSGDLILMTACHGMQNTNLADAFMNKGASAVFGFSNSVYKNYARPVTAYVLEKMTFVNPDTNEYYTLEQALESAKLAYASNDREWWELHQDEKKKSSVAEPKIQGKTDYQLAEYAPIQTGLYMNVQNDSNGFNLGYDTLFLTQDETGTVCVDACWWNIAYGAYTWAKGEYSGSDFRITYEGTTEPEPVRVYPYEASVHIEYFGEEIYLTITYEDGTSAGCRYEYVRPEQLVLTEEQMAEIASDLRVPEELEVTCQQQEPYFWEAGARWLTSVNVSHEGRTVASASVDVYTGEVVKDILTYSGG